MAIRSDSINLGDCVSINQYQSSFPGQLPHTKGKEKPKLRYSGGTIMVESASGAVFLKHQVSLKVGETLKTKKAFEQWLKEFGVEVKRYRADNVPFSAEAFKRDLEVNNQTIDFSGVGAHHQNGVAKQAIGTITCFAHATLLQQAIMWPDQADLKLWPFAMDHAVFLWNHLPKQEGGLSPMEVLSKQVMHNYEALVRSHVWGCPVYVLDPKLQDGKKLPKWDPRARRGMYLWCSTNHSSASIAKVLNLCTGYVSPQFHLVFDDKFTSVNNLESAGLVDPARFDADHWERIIESGHELYLDLNEPDVPDLDDTWLTPNERCIQYTSTEEPIIGLLRLLDLCLQREEGRLMKPQAELHR